MLLVYLKKKKKEYEPIKFISKSYLAQRFEHLLMIAIVQAFRVVFGHRRAALCLSMNGKQLGGGQVRPQRCG